MKNLFDVIIIGGSHAGLSAALVLGRSLRNVVVIDNNKPRNAVAQQSHGFYTRDGKNPVRLLEIAKDQLKQYNTVSIKNGIASSIAKDEDQFIVYLDKDILNTRKIILATGVKDNLPNIKGLETLWGTHLFHCPYCHGWEVRNTRLALIANNKKDFDFIKLVSHWTLDLTVFLQEVSFNENEISELKEKGIHIIAEKISDVKKLNDEACEINYGLKNETFRGIFCKPRIEYNNQLASIAGCKLGESGEVITDEYQQTSVEGIFAAGDLTLQHFHQVAVAAAAGLKAGIAVNTFLL